jgi:hypothetical protein
MGPADPIDLARLLLAHGPMIPSTPDGGNEHVFVRATARAPSRPPR